MQKSIVYLALGILTFLQGTALAAQDQEDNTQQPQVMNTAGVEVEGYTLSLKTEPENPRPGEMLRLVISLKNVSGQEKTTTTVNPLLAYRFEVTLPNKEKAPLTLYGQSKLQGIGLAALSAITSRERRVLKPGEAYTDVLALNRIFDMSLSGRYKIVAFKNVGKSGSATEAVTLTSNITEVLIEEKGDDSWLD